MQKSLEENSRDWRTRPAGLVLLAALMLWCASASLLHAAEPQPGNQPAETTLNLKADSIVFDRSTGDILLERNVHVTYNMGDQPLTVDCDKMTAKRKDEGLESVVAVGNVALTMKESTGTAARATFDFKGNIIVLYGDKDKPATMKQAGMVWTGPEIVYHSDTGRVEMKHGEGVINVKSAPGEKNPPKEKPGPGP